MVRAELIYNPYLLETKVFFNGNPPRINSLVEKYQNEKLQTWVNDIPAIFYDEMNGFNFELDFSGTKLDFEELKKSFIQAGVGKDKVQLFHKSLLGSRNEKMQAVQDLLNWLKNTPNRKFDQEEFFENNKDLFNGAYPYVVIGGSLNNDHLFDDIRISVDNIESADELKKTDLHSTPILFYLDRKSVQFLQFNLRTLLKRDDVNEDQLFFMIDPAVSGKVKRVIQDLGVKTPQIVTDANDPIIYRYLEIFPVSETLYESIKVFREQTDLIGTILEEENRQSAITNKDIHERINILEDILGRLKHANDIFLAEENLNYPETMERAKTELIESINHWKIRKTKITKEDEASMLSKEFETEVNRSFERYQRRVNQCHYQLSSEIYNRCEQWYKEAHYKENAVICEIEKSSLPDYSIPEFAAELMEIKEEQMVMPKEDFFGKLFKNVQDDAPKEPVLETTFYCEKWRAHVLSIVEPIAEKKAQEVFDDVCNIYKQLSDLYINQIQHLIQDVSTEKETVASQLSEDERLLQTDNDWHTTFCDKLHEIERV